MRSGYDVAQICTNGHLITEYASDSSFRKNFCSKCGHPTIINCSHCNNPIRGKYHVPGAFIHSEYNIPAFCHNCGKPYPWTTATIQEFEEIIDMDDELDIVDKTILKEKFPQLLVDSPGTSAAALRVSKTLKIAANTTVQAIRSAIASKVAGHALELLGWK